MIIFPCQLCVPVMMNQPVNTCRKVMPFVLFLDTWQIKLFFCTARYLTLRTKKIPSHFKTNPVVEIMNVFTLNTPKISLFFTYFSTTLFADFSYVSNFIQTEFKKKLLHTNQRRLRFRLVFFLLCFAFFNNLYQ